jgi:asparagine synthase (glutamine-hydrolysing)
MCGIIGVVGKFETENFLEALGKISHRGPDDSGIYHHSNLYLGHQRLSIQDLSENGHQPMHSADGNWTIIFNGEIYNHLDIRKELESKYVFKSSGDTETLLYAFIEYGEDVLKRLNGIFSFAIFNHTLEELHIVRDQFGIKPLYYYFKDEILIFGSEIKSFTEIRDFDSTIDLRCILNYITFLWSTGDKTPFLNVKKLLPGHYIKLNTGRVNNLSIHKYYEIPFNGKYLESSENDIIDGLERHLIKAVERQLLSDVPVAFFLSGGLDSSAIVAIAKKLRPFERLRCYTIKNTDGNLNDEGFADDLSYARKLSKILDLDLVEVEIDVNIISDFDKMIYHLDEPQADAAPLNVLRICERAKKDGYKVLLGGTAGDDLFTGYRRHQALNLEQKIKKIPLPIRKAIKFLATFLGNKNSTIRRVKKIAQNIEKPSVDRLYGYFEWLNIRKAKSLLNKQNRSDLEDYSPLSYFKDLLLNIPDEHSEINKYLYWEIKTFLVDHNLNYTDKMSMASGIEVRVPFLDLELVEYSAKIPPEMKLKGNVVKYILKKTMESYLPHEIIYRPKTGFGAPVRQWVTHDLNEKIQDYLGESSILKRGIFDPLEISNLISENKSGKIDASYSILALMAIESWFRQFVDNNGRKKIS